MSVLAWLAIPLAATFVAIVWAYFAARPRRSARVLDTMAAYERFRAAMAAPSSCGPSTPRRPGDESRR
ncbi:MAG TPA: hypothetical protein VKP64_09770 [Mycobacteriales bacterium]|nr:hypothetical protein [Mycobacteriales bacterium]